MLRIGMTPQSGPGPQPPQGEAGIPPELAAALGAAGGSPDGEPTKTTRSAVQKVDPDTAGYLDPDHGPFICSNCIHFQGKGSCEIVDGSIDPNGCCNLFKHGGDEQNEGSPDPDAAQEALEGGQGGGPDQLS